MAKQLRLQFRKFLFFSPACYNKIGGFIPADIYNFGHNIHNFFFRKYNFGLFSNFEFHISINYRAVAAWHYDIATYGRLSRYEFRNYFVSKISLDCLVIAGCLLPHKFRRYLGSMQPAEQLPRSGRLRSSGHICFWNGKRLRSFFKDFVECLPRNAEYCYF